MDREIRNGLILTALASSLGAAEPKPKITVMVYNYAAIQADVLAQTKREAARIYGHAGIATEWLDCALSPKEAALFPACRIEVGPAKLAIRLLPQALAQHLPHVEDSLGFAMMPRDGSFATIANIFADQTEHLCKHFNGDTGAKLHPGNLLGVVVAHELAHLLLGDGSHAHAGIMRAHWQRKDLKLIVEGVMTFTPSEAESLRKSVRVRMAAQAANSVTLPRYLENFVQNILGDHMKVNNLSMSVPAMQFRWWECKVTSRSLILSFAAMVAFAGNTSSNVPVTTYVTDLNASGIPYSIQSDSQAGPVHSAIGEYDNNLQNVVSELNANTYNQEPPGDWWLDLLSSTARTMRLTLSANNEVPNGTAPPNPPFWGTENLISKFEEKCTAISLDIGTMNAVGQTIHCPAIFRFNWSGSYFYRVYMTGSWGGFAPESTMVQIQCNKLGTNGYCSDWYVDPIPVVNPDGTPSPGQAIGRLVAEPTHNGTSYNDGNFYITFHVHVTRP